MAKTHLIGMLLGVEEDWPAAFEALLGRADLTVREGGETHTFTTERVTIEPFDLRMKPRHSLLIDRLGWWYPMPREWLKKVVLMDRVHLLNNPFTFQAMEEARLLRDDPAGAQGPGDVDAAQQDAAGQPSFRRHRAALSALFRPGGGGRQRLEMPLYMKPFDGGAWVGVSRIENNEAMLYSARVLDELGTAAHASAGAQSMAFDAFARSLGIGAEVDRPQLPRPTSRCMIAIPSITTS